MRKIENQDDRDAFAESLGTSWPYLIQLSNGFKRPSPDLAQKIYMATNKKVPLSHLRPDIWGRSLVKR